MWIDASDLTSRDAYWLLISAIVPRPIAWVSSLSPDGVANLAPFSFYMGVTSDPPILAIAIGRRRGEPKDTARNIETTKEFVVNLATRSLAESMVRTSADWGPQVDEFVECGLTKAASKRVRPPRVAESPVAMECTLHRLQTVGRGNTSLVLGEVVCFHVAEHLWTGRDIDPAALAPIGRMGGALYAPVTALEEMARPTVDAETGRITHR